MPNNDREALTDHLADLVEHIIVNIVDSPEEVDFVVSEDDNGSYIEVHVADEDTGKVIGRRGRAIKAIRTLASAAALKHDTSVQIEIAD